jgi:hypothetical protein
MTQPQRSNEVIAITDWLKDCLLAGARVVVPAIVYYEIKRELPRANKAIGIARLDAFVNAAPDRYVRTSRLLISTCCWPRRLGGWEERRLLRQPTRNIRRNSSQPDTGELIDPMTFGNS